MFVYNTKTTQIVEVLLMAKKLEGNGMSSSRMMLPEHVEAIQEQNRQIKRTEKPVLDEQEIAIIDNAFLISLRNKSILIITLYGKFEFSKLTGTIIKIDNWLRIAKIKYEDPSEEVDECVWISMNEVLKAEVKEVEDWDEGEIDW
jgi:hypothetical protein